MKRSITVLILSLFFLSSEAQIFRKLEVQTLTSSNTDSRAVAWVDFNGDGLQDIFITNGPSFGQNNMLFRNDGNGSFTYMAGSPITSDGDPSDGASWADFNNDDHPDVFVANWYDQDNLLYENVGGTAFNALSSSVVASNNGFSETGSWGDYDLDGLVDLYVSNSYGLKENFLYHNDGNGSFSRVMTGIPSTETGTTRSVNWIDYDQDGDPDLFVTNEANEANTLYRNDSSAFTKLNISGLCTDLGNSQSSSWSDYDNDGDWDVFVSNFGQNNVLYRNEGLDSFTAVTTGIVAMDGARSFGTNWGDINNDGYEDLLVVNAYSTGATLNNLLYLNQGDGSFVKVDTGIVSTEDGWTFGAAFGDMDNDGDLDLMAANNFNGGQKNSLYENLESDLGIGNHWLNVRLKGGPSNMDAIGARVILKATIGGQSITQMREISAQTGYCGQNMMPAHFGLADATIADSLIIYWPSGNMETLANLSADSNYVVLEGQGTVLSLFQGLNQGKDAIRIYPNPVEEGFQIQGDEDVFDLSLYDSMGRELKGAVPSRARAGEWIEVPKLRAFSGQVIFLRAGGTAVPVMVK